MRFGMRRNKNSFNTISVAGYQFSIVIKSNFTNPSFAAIAALSRYIKPGLGKDVIIMVAFDDFMIIGAETIKYLRFCHAISK